MFFLNQTSLESKDENKMADEGTMIDRDQLMTMIKNNNMDQIQKMPMDMQRRIEHLEERNKTQQINDLNSKLINKS